MIIIKTMTIISRLVFVALLLLLLVPCAQANPYGTETLLPTNYSTNQRSAAMYGTKIVWHDPDVNAGDIFLYDISTGNVTQLTNNPSTQQLPGIYRDLIIWQDTRIRGSGDIYLFNSSDNHRTRITDNHALDPSYARISGDKIVWQDDRSGRWDIYMFNITEGQEYLITPATAGSDQEYPAVFGPRIVWQDDRNATNGDVEIFMNTTGTWTESLITPDNGLGVGNDGSTDGAWQGVPAISDTTIVWEDNRNQDPFSMQVPNIYSYNPGVGEQRVSDNLTSDFLPAYEPVMYPSIDGNRIVWKDYRNQGAGDIYLNDTGRVPPAQLLLSTGPKVKSAPKISGNRVLWTEETGGVSKIHLFTIGTPQVCPSATFTENTSGGGAPISITFTDTTPVIRPSHWYWDFGDGSVAYGQNPLHLYTSNGQYLVNLTVSDDVCRNRSADHIITVGKPVANFVAVPTSGLVPLSVRFNDISTGSPTAFGWDFENDSTIDSHLRNATHVYTVPGVYTVRFNATNVFGTDTRIRTAYISALAGAHATATIPIKGITVDSRFGGQFLTYNSVLAGLPVLNPAHTVLVSRPPGSYGWQNITFVSSDSPGFFDAGNGTYFGNVSDSYLRTTDIPATGFSPDRGDPVYVSDRMLLARYPSSGYLNAEIWESATASDNSTLSDIALSSSFTSLDSVGYSTRLSRSLGTLGTSTINMSVSSGWVAGSVGSAAGRNRTYILTYGIDPLTGNKIGAVLGTRYVCSDSSLDYFEADIPNQYSYFNNYFLTQLSGSGNLVQLITLSVTSHVNQPEQNNKPSSDSDSDSTSAGGAGAGKIIIPTTPPPTPPTMVPADPGKSAKIYTNANGVVTQATRLPSTDGRAVVFIGEGIVAKDAGGKPLSIITIKAAFSGNLPAVPSGSPFMFAGMAYDLGPDGATFSPPVSLTFTLPQAQWGQDYTVKFFDQKSGTWQDLPTTFDTATGTVTAHFSHLCVFALFTEPRASPVTTPAATPLPVPAAPQVKAQPPTTAVSIFTSMMGWAAGLIVDNAVILVAVIILAIVVYRVKQGRFPG
jgi:beta propeller repeat protein